MSRNSRQTPETLCQQTLADTTPGLRGTQLPTEGATRSAPPTPPPPPTYVYLKMVFSLGRQVIALSLSPLSTALAWGPSQTSSLTGAFICWSQGPVAIFIEKTASRQAIRLQRPNRGDTGSTQWNAALLQPAVRKANYLRDRFTNSFDFPS